VKELECTLALDVGGTNIDYAAIGHGLSVIGDVHSIQSMSDSSQDVIIDKLSSILSQLTREAESVGFQPKTCAMAFPGPFDYEQGVSHMTHKFKGLHGLDLKQTLRKACSLPISFLNDADAFGYGVLNKHFSQPPERLATITLGTGIGSSLFVHGELINLEIWDSPYRDSTLEDYISTNALVGAYEKVSGEQLTVAAIAKLAQAGERTATTTFESFGKELGKGLAKALATSDPEHIVLGGGISKSFSLFGPNAETAYRLTTGTTTSIEVATEPYLSLYGAAAFVF